VREGEDSLGKGASILMYSHLGGKQKDDPRKEILHYIKGRSKKELLEIGDCNTGGQDCGGCRLKRNLVIHRHPATNKKKNEWGKVIHLHKGVQL